MSGKTGIEWTDCSWNPVVGCRKVSEGCRLCYAKTSHDRRHVAFLAGKKVAPQYAEPFETVQLKPDRLDRPLSLRRPSRIFVNSVSDLFHDDVPSDFIAMVFSTMACAQRHVFQVLTKRPARMQALLSDPDFQAEVDAYAGAIAMERTDPLDRRTNDLRATLPEIQELGYLPNVWLGVSVEHQEAADERIPLLLRTPAAVRFLSCEPLLGAVDIEFWLGGLCVAPGDHEAEHQFGALCDERSIDWVIAGGESGSLKQEPRPMHPDWPRSLRDQCVRAGVPFFFKQLGDWVHAPGPVGETIGEFDIHVFEDGVRMGRVGTTRAGRLLDGRTWDEFPAAAV